jgi:hypothetical protein
MSPWYRAAPDAAARCPTNLSSSRTSKPTTDYDKGMTQTDGLEIIYK